MCSQLSGFYSRSCDPIRTETFGDRKWNEAGGRRSILAALDHNYPQKLIITIL